MRAVSVVRRVSVVAVAALVVGGGLVLSTPEASAASPPAFGFKAGGKGKPLSEAAKTKLKARAASSTKVPPVPTPVLPKSKLTVREAPASTTDTLAKPPPDPPPTGWPATPTLADTSSDDVPERYAHQGYEVSNKNLAYCLDHFPFEGFVTEFRPVNHHFDCQMSEWGFYLADAFGIYSEVDFQMVSLWTAMDSASPSREFHVSHYLVSAELDTSVGFNDEILSYPMTIAMPCTVFTGSVGACYNISPGSAGTTAPMQHWYDAANGVPDSDPALWPNRHYIYAQEGDGWAKSSINDGVTYYNAHIQVSGNEFYGMTVRCDYSPSTGPIMPTGCNMSGSDNVYQRPSLLPGSAFPEASQHVFDSLYNSTNPLVIPSTPWPGLRTATVVPGLKSSGVPFTRISNPDLNRNARKVGSKVLCAESPPVHLGVKLATQQCDEQPKAAVAQGAASNGFLSLRNIDGEQNRAEGNTFLIWSAMNRILPETANAQKGVRNPVGDPFWADVRR